MRAYLPVTRAQLAALLEQGTLPGPARGCAVDPAWRAGAPEVDEEEWEYEAQATAAQAVPDPTGFVLAVDVEPPAGAEFDDGWVDLPGPIARRDVAAVLDAELAWFGVQEVDALLRG